MDSTTVSIIADAATKLGMTGASAFTAYLAAKLAIHVIWASILIFIILRVTALIKSVIDRNRVLDAWYQKAGGYGASAVQSLLDYIQLYQPKK